MVHGGRPEGVAAGEQGDRGGTEAGAKAGVALQGLTVVAQANAMSVTKLLLSMRTLGKVSR